MADGGAQKKPGKYTLALFGLLMTVVGFAVAVLNWQSLLTDGSYYVSSELVGPALGFLGLAVLLAPAPLETVGDRPAPAPSWFHKLRQVMAKSVLLFGLVATAVNYALFKGWLPPF